MIIVKLIGGLGNQMFQYAAGKALAYRHGVQLKVDVSFLNKNVGEAYTKRTYELGVFKAEIEIATEQETSKFLRHNTYSWHRELQRTLPFLFTNLYVAESGSAYNKAFEQYPNNTYLDGFWQNENYFLSIRKQLLIDFQLKQTVPTPVTDLLKLIETSNSVAIHVRRGDYISLPSANSFHGTCSLSYYEMAVTKLIELTGAVKLFIFSDDLDWCKANFKFEEPLCFVNHREMACWDLFLMNHCKHMIIANSSFSWWGAWLNQNSNKKVIAPENWFVGTPSKPLGILPPEWLVQA